MRSERGMPVHVKRNSNARADHASKLIATLAITAKTAVPINPMTQRNNLLSAAACSAFWLAKSVLRLAKSTLKSAKSDLVARCSYLPRG